MTKSLVKNKIGNLPLHGESCASLHYQLPLPITRTPPVSRCDEPLEIAETLVRLMASDLTFEHSRSRQAHHSLHAFAAKFPPQLPRLFIQELTLPGETVLDPMAGSGTTLVEAVLANRYAVGVDIDPLAILISKVKTTPVDLVECVRAGNWVIEKADASSQTVDDDQLSSVYSPQAIEFFRYWFEPAIVDELFALVQVIRQVNQSDVQDFLKVIFSSCIITKSGGVTRARDLAHSRPHRDLKKPCSKSAIATFRERLKAGVDFLESLSWCETDARILCADARCLPVASNSVHLVVTSPPYAANAIDYMRAHKFSLIWLGFEPSNLTRLRREYIGAEIRASDELFPSETACRVLFELRKHDVKKSAVVAHYFNDVQMALKEMLRVLMPGRAAVLVVGSSNIRGVEIHAPTVVAELAQAAGFDLVGLAKREIPRNARMMPVSHHSERTGIEARMHEEGVIGLLKPQGEHDANSTRDSFVAGTIS